MNWISYLLAIGAGAANPVQAGANAELKYALNDPVWSAITVYLSGLLGMLLIQGFVRSGFPGSDKLAAVPWWAWTGGLLSIASTVAGLTFAQKMGSGVFTGISVTASLAASVALDHYGLIGFKQHPASLLRIAGSGLMILGLWLVAKF